MSQSKFHFITNSSEEFFIDEGCHIIEILNNSAHPNISISQARVEPMSTTECHFLNETVEIYYILEGVGTAYIDDEPIKVKKGDIIYIPKGVHQYILNETHHDLLFLCICTPRWIPNSYKSVQ